MTRLFVLALCALLAAALLLAYLLVYWPLPSKEAIKANPIILEGRPPFYVSVMRLAVVILTLWGGPVLAVEGAKRIHRRFHVRKG